MSLEDALVATYPSRIAAELASGRLAAHGIDSRIESDDVGGAYPVLESHGVRLFAKASDSERAVAILETVDDAAGDASGNLADAEDAVRLEGDAGSSYPPLVYAALLIVFGVFFGFLLGEFRIGQFPMPSADYSGVIELDQNQDGRSDAWYEYEGDNYTSMKFDRNFDGILDGWNYLKDGSYVRSELDDNFDGKIDRWVEYKFAEYSVSASDLDANGFPDFTVRYEHGVPLSHQIHPNGKAVEREGEYENGVLRRVYSISPDGTRTLVVKYDEFGRMQLN